MEASIDNPLKTCSFDPEDVKINNEIISSQIEEDLTTFHTKMQNSRFKTIREKIKEREKVANSISRSIDHERDRSKEKYVKKIESQSFLNENEDHTYARAKLKHHNFQTTQKTVKDKSNDLSFGERSKREDKSNLVDQYYTKYVDNFEPKIDFDRFKSIETSRINEYRETLDKQVEEKKLNKKKQQDEKNKTLEKKLIYSSKIQNQKTELESFNKMKEMKDDFSKSNYYLTEIKRLQEKEKLLKKSIIAQNSNLRKAKNSKTSRVQTSIRLKNY